MTSIFILRGPIFFINPVTDGGGYKDQAGRSVG